jgi:heat shock protein HslJ
MDKNNSLLKVLVLATGTFLVLTLVGIVIVATDDKDTSSGTSSSIEDESSNNVSTDFSNEVSSWQLTSLVVAGDQVVIPEQANVTLNIDNSSFSGVAACNNYFGSFNYEEDKIVVSPIGSTQMFCQPPELMDLETQYLQALQSVTTASMQNDNTLVLQDSTSQTTLTFTFLNN